MNWLFIIILQVAMLLSAFCGGHSTIKGVVTDASRQPLAFVNVYLYGTFDGAMTAEDGSFSFSTGNTGEVTLIAGMLGYRQHNESIKLSSGEIVTLNIILRETYVLGETVVISASSYGMEEGKGIVVSAMDIMMTPGGAADIYQTLKTLPGLTQVSESAELYVRGGDPTETLTLLDGASLYHPYTFESAYGGLFSNINTGIVRGMYFSSGGFSVKYGNVLSGVLDMQTKNEPEYAAYEIGLNLAGGQFSAGIPIITNRAGLRVDARRSFLDPMMWLNGGMDDFIVIPRSQDIGLLISGRYSDTGRLKVYAAAAQDKQGVHIRNAGYDGPFRGNSDNYLINVQHTGAINPDLIMKTGALANRYAGRWNMGILDMKRTGDTYKLRTDLEYYLPGSLKLLIGGEAERRVFTYEGRVPEKDYDIRLQANSIPIDVSYGMTRAGGYTEIEIPEIPFLKKLSAAAGVRGDYAHEPGLLWLDPRLSLGYALGSNSAMLASIGIFQQAADPRLYDPGRDKNKMKPMRAMHYIAAYDRSIGLNTDFRVEFYHKKYDRLPLETEESSYDNSGHGYSRGIDILLKGNPFPRFDGWISYGFVETKRLWLDYESYAPSDYDITHNFTAVFKYNFSNSVHTGINFKYATGRPYTPVTGSRYDIERDIYEPVYGLKNSERYKNYCRLDLRLTYLHRLFGRYFSVFYLEAMNVLDIKNLFGYAYSFDYSERDDVISYFGRRTLVFGMVMSF